MEKGIEIVTLDLSAENRLELAEAIKNRMSEICVLTGNCKKLDLGFELPIGWPVAESARPTLAQLVVLANKLKFRIVIEKMTLSPL